MVEKMEMSGIRLVRYASCDFQANLCLPNEDFGKRNSALGVSFRWTLRGCEYSIRLRTIAKSLQKCQPELVVDIIGDLSKMEIVEKKGTSCRRLPDMRFIRLTPMVRILCSPNEYFGKQNMSGVSFRVILRWVVAQIEYSHPRKVPRKTRPTCSGVSHSSSLVKQSPPLVRTFRQSVNHRCMLIFVEMFALMVGDCPTNREEWHTGSVSFSKIFVWEA